MPSRPGQPARGSPGFMPYVTILSARAERIVDPRAISSTVVRDLRRSEMNPIIGWSRARDALPRWTTSWPRRRAESWPHAAGADHRRHRSASEGAAAHVGPAASSILILECFEALGPDDLQEMPLQPDEFGIRRDLRVAWTRQRHAHVLDNAAWARAHHQHSVGEKNCLVDVMRHEDYRNLELGPQPQHMLLHHPPRLRIQPPQ